MRKYDVDYMGTLTEDEIKAPGSGFNSFQKEEIENMVLFEEAEFVSPDSSFNIRRIE